MLVAVSSEPKLTFPSTVSRPDNVSKVERELIHLVGAHRRGEAPVDAAIE